MADDLVKAFEKFADRMAGLLRPEHATNACAEAWVDAAEAINEHKRQRDSAVEVLALLVALKDGPRDEAYRAQKDAAWAAARRVVAYRPSEPPAGEGSAADA